MTRAIIKLVIEGDARHKHTISEALFAAGAGGVEEQGSRRKPTLIVYAATEAEAETLRERFVAELAERAPSAAVNARIEVLPDSDWESAWMKYLQPVAITPRLVLQPVNDETPAPTGMQRIVFEPELAFGDGGHATTRLAARAVERFCAAQPGGRVLDYGTGSGVLSIVAVLSGAAQAVGIDIDEVSVAAARRNAKLNQVLGKCVIQNTDADLPGDFQLVVANIETNVLLSLAARLADVSRNASELVVTGFLSDQAEDIARAFREHGFAQIDAENEDGWALLRLAKISRSDG